MKKPSKGRHRRKNSKHSTKTTSNFPETNAQIPGDTPPKSQHHRRPPCHGDCVADPTLHLPEVNPGTSELNGPIRETEPRLPKFNAHSPETEQELSESRTQFSGTPPPNSPSLRKLSQQTVSSSEMTPHLPEIKPQIEEANSHLPEIKAHIPEPNLPLLETSLQNPDKIPLTPEPHTQTKTPKPDKVQKKSRHHRRHSNHIPLGLGRNAQLQNTDADQTPRPSSAATVVSLAPSFSDNETVFKARTERKRRKSIWRVIHCGQGVKPLPVDVFRQVLMHVPVRDVLQRCSLVCRSWLAACRDPGYWQRRCEAEGKFVPPVTGQPPKSFIMLYFREPYTRNLLRNTHALEGLDHWDQPRGGQVVSMEDSSEGAHAIGDYIPVEETKGRIHNWVTSYQYTFMSQSVVLLEEGCSRTVLDELRPPISVSAWCAAHEESGAKFYMLVRLIDKRKKEAGRFETELDLTSLDLRKVWHKVGHTFTDYRAGVRKVVFKMGGVATQGWRGHYGAKFTLPCVRFDFHFNSHADHHHNT